MPTRRSPRRVLPWHPLTLLSSLPRPQQPAVLLAQAAATWPLRFRVPLNRTRTTRPRRPSRPPAYLRHRRCRLKMSTLTTEACATLPGRPQPPIALQVHSSPWTRWPLIPVSVLLPARRSPRRVLRQPLTLLSSAAATRARPPRPSRPSLTRTRPTRPDASETSGSPPRISTRRVDGCLGAGWVDFLQDDGRRRKYKLGQTNRDFGSILCFFLFHHRKLVRGKHVRIGDNSRT